MLVLRSLIVLVLALPIAACFQDPVIDASSETDFSRSYQKVLGALRDTDKQQLDNSLKDIVLVQAGIYAPTLEAKTSQESTTGLPTDGFAKGLSEAMMQTVSMVITNQWSANRSELVVRHARAVVDGRTATEILALAESERDRALREAASIYREQLQKAKEELQELTAEGAATAARAAQTEALLQSVIVTRSKFYYQESRYLTEPVIAFTIENTTPVPIKKIFLHGRLQTPGRAIPWVDESFNYSFPGGLEPGEKQQLSLAPSSFGAWGKVPKKVVAGAVLDLKVVAIEDAADRRIGGQSIDDSKERKKALEDGIRALEDKIRQLEGSNGRRS